MALLLIHALNALIDKEIFVFSIQMRTLCVIASLLFAACVGNGPNKADSSSKVAADSGYKEEVTIPDTFPQSPKSLNCDCFPDIKFDRQCTDTFDLRWRTNKNPETGLVPISAAERSKYLQWYDKKAPKENFYFYASLPCVDSVKSMLIYDEVDGEVDDKLLLRLVYDPNLKLKLVDTIVYSYGDGQWGVDGLAFLDHGALISIQITEETTLDNTDSMASRIDSVITRHYYEVLRDGAGFPIYQSKQRTEDTWHWEDRWATNKPIRIKRKYVTDLAPKGSTIVQTAIGDLDGDYGNEIAMTVTPTVEGEENPPRDLMIIGLGRHGFELKFHFKGILPGEKDGGFHDPISDVGGIKIENGKLIIHIFGGSAHKWESINTYQYVDSLKNFYLVRQEGRSFHSPTLSSAEEILYRLEDKIGHRIPLTIPEKKELKEARKVVRDFSMQGTDVPIGAKKLEELKW